MRSVLRSPKGLRLGVLAALLLPVIACNRTPEEGEGSDDQTTGPMAAKPAQRKDPLADMVSAVSGSKASAPVELKFALAQRPVVGQPVEVEIAVLPVSPLDRVAANFQAGAGLEMRSGEEMAAVNKPEPGMPLAHRLTIVPQRDGIFFVSAVVHADSPEQSLTRTFSIPIIAGEGQSQPKDTPAAPRPEPKTP